MKFHKSKLKLYILIYISFTSDKMDLSLSWFILKNILCNLIWNIKIGKWKVENPTNTWSF